MRLQPRTQADSVPFGHRKDEAGLNPTREITHKDHGPVEYSDRSGRWVPSPTRLIVDASTQEEFAATVCQLLRDSRKRQRLTQADVAARTGGLVSKAALANYETGHRSLRIDVLWLLTRALGEDLGELLFEAEQSLTQQIEQRASSVLIDPDRVRASEDPRLAPVRRWVELRQGSAVGNSGRMVLDGSAMVALATLMQLSVAECAALLETLVSPGRSIPQARPVPSTERSVAPDVG